MKILIAAASAALCLAPAVALAQTAAVPTGLYGTLGFADAHTDGVDLGAIQGRLGTRLNRWFGVEGELAAGINDDKTTTTVGGVNIDSKVKLQNS